MSFLEKDQSLLKLKDIHIQKDKLVLIRPDAFFILLLGSSAVGKTSIIKELNKISENKYNYISPYTTRPLRKREKDKISVTDEQFDKLENSGLFVNVNHLYGVRYGTPISSILDSLSNNKIPILDYPLNKVDTLIRPEYDLLNIYIFPPTINTLLERMNRTSRNDSSRINVALEELSMLNSSRTPNPNIHYSIINENNSINKSAREIQNLVSEIKTRKK